MTSRGNITTLGALITYLPATQEPYVGQIFGLNATTQAGELMQLAAQIQRVNWWCESEAVVLKYALENLKGTPYSSVPVLYRGGGRDVPFFCKSVTRAPTHTAWLTQPQSVCRRVGPQH